MYKKTINKIRIRIIKKPHTFPSKNSLTPFLKLAIVVAWRIGNGRVFHMSTILLKKLNLNVLVLFPIFSP